MSKKICFFGSFLPEYNRNQVLLTGLKSHDMEVIYCNDRSQNLLNHYLSLIKKFIIKCLKCEVIFVAAVSTHDVLVAWILSKVFRKKLIYDAFISLYDTYVFDRQYYKPKSFAAIKYYFWDYLACHLSDMILTDSLQHAKYFSKTFKINRKRIMTIYIGADESFFVPQSTNRKSKKKFIVEYHGSFQPLHGLDYVLKAASLLDDNKDILFKFAGKGQLKKNIIAQARKLKLQNVKFLPNLDKFGVKQLIASADVCLGTFGKTLKANNTIPNKAYEVIAMEKPFINMDSDAAREVFENNKNALLVSNDDPSSLSNSILRLKNTPNLAQRIAKEAYRLFLQKYTSIRIGSQLIKYFDRI